MKPVRITEATILRLIQLKALYSQQAVFDKEIAQMLLNRVDRKHQRPLSETRVKRYLRDMNAGSWVPGAAAFVLDGKGRLIHGQHLATAFIRSDLKILHAKIEVNPDDNAILGYDHGRTWSSRDALKWGEHSGDLAPVLTVLWQYEQGHYKGTAYTAARSADQYPTDSELKKMAEMHPDAKKYLRQAPPTFKDRGVPVGALIAAVYVLHQLDLKKAAAFTTSVFEGTDIPPKSPIQVLRYSIESRSRKKKVRLRNGEAVAWVFKAWNAYLNNQVLAKPILRAKEPFPEPIPAPVAPPSPARRIQ